MNSRFYVGNLGTAIYVICGLGSIICFGIAGRLFAKKEFSRLAVKLRTFAETVVEPKAPSNPKRRKMDRRPA